MKNSICLTILLTVFLSCTSQNVTLKSLDSLNEMNYIFSRINPSNIIQKDLFGRSTFVKIFEISDSKITPETFLEGHEFFISYFISVNPDGDYYSYSKLFKLEGLINPIVKEIKEISAPDFSIKIEHGTDSNRKMETIKLEGFKQ